MTSQLRGSGNPVQGELQSGWRHTEYNQSGSVFPQTEQHQPQHLLRRMYR